jgi:hypothetical protein
MLGNTVYNALLNALRKDFRGQVVSLDEFNILSELVNQRILSAYASRFEEDIESSSDLGFLKVVGYTLNLTSGVATLPSNYYRLTGDPYYTDTSVTPNKVRYIDILTSKEHTYRQRDFLTQASTTYPTCIVGTQDAYKALQIRVAPTTITSIKVDYLRETATPYLDYYVNDTTYLATYLTAGQSITIPTGSTYRDGTTGTKASLTVDWEWSESDLPLIITYFLDALGIAIPDEMLIQAGSKDREEILSE